MKKWKLFILSVLVIGCHRYDDRLQIVNRTNSEITITTSLDTVPVFPSLNKKEFYFRTRFYQGERRNLIHPGFTDSWSLKIHNSKNNKLNLFVYNIDSMFSYNNIDTLIKSRIYNRYEFSEKELEEMNWEVVIDEYQ